MKATSRRMKSSEYFTPRTRCVKKTLARYLVDDLKVVRRIRSTAISACCTDGQRRKPLLVVAGIET